MAVVRAELDRREHPARMFRTSRGAWLGAFLEWNVGSLKKLTAICSKPGRVCAFPKRHRNFIFEGDYACIRLRQAMHRANSARKAAASRFRLMAAAVR